MDDNGIEWNWELAMGTLLCLLTGSLASGGGIGGGGIFIPIFILIMGLPTAIAVPVSKIAILGGAIGGYIVLVKLRHPLADRPCIDYDVALLLEPLILAGTIIGVYLNVIFPSYVIVFLFAGFLVFVGYRTFKKGFETLREERENVRVATADSTAGLATTENKFEFSNLETDGSGLLDDDEAHITEASRGDFELQKLLIEESRTPWRKIGLLVGVFIGLLLIIVLKGGSTGKSIIGIECGTIAWWLVLGLAYPYLAATTFIVGRMLLREHQRRQQLRYPFQKGDILWDNKKVLVYPLVAILAGVAAGLLGIGGGMVAGPLMLEMGCLAQVTTTTSSFMMLFTAASTSVQFFVIGRLPWGYALWFGGVGFVAAMIGQYAVKVAIQKWHKQSILNFLMAGLITLSALVMLLLLIVQLVHDIRSDSDMGLHGPCSTSLH